MGAKKKVSSADSAEAAPARQAPALIATHVQRAHDDMKTLLGHPVFSNICNADPLAISQG